MNTSEYEVRPSCCPVPKSAGRVHPAVQPVVIDPTLTKSGEAADAKVTGDAIRAYDGRISELENRPGVLDCIYVKDRVLVFEEPLLV